MSLTAQAPNWTEARLGQECGNWLQRFDRHAYDHFYHIPNGGLRSKVEASRLHAQHVKRGVLDYNLDLARHGYHGLRIELKTDIGRLRPEQEEWIARNRAAGFKAEVIRSLEAFQELLTEYLA